MSKEVATQETNLFNDVCNIIENSQKKVACKVNKELTIMYWNIGSLINIEVLKNERATYGEQVLQSLSLRLQEKYGKKGFELRILRRMVQFAILFPDFQIVSTLSTQLSWSHFTEVISIKDDVQRDFYATMSATENWSVRVLRERIDSMLYERTLISGKPDEFVKKKLATLRESRVRSEKRKVNSVRGVA